MGATHFPRAGSRSKVELGESAGMEIDTSLMHADHRQHLVEYPDLDDTKCGMVQPFSRKRENLAHVQNGNLAWQSQVPLNAIENDMRLAECRHPVDHIEGTEEQLGTERDAALRITIMWLLEGSNAIEVGRRCGVWFYLYRADLLRNVSEESVAKELEMDKSRFRALLSDALAKMDGIDKAAYNFGRLCDWWADATTLRERGAKCHATAYRLKLGSGGLTASGLRDFGAQIDFSHEGVRKHIRSLDETFPASA